MVGASPFLLTVNSAPFEPVLTLPAVVVHLSRPELWVKSKVCFDSVVPGLAGQVSIIYQRVFCFKIVEYEIYFSLDCSRCTFDLRPESQRPSLQRHTSSSTAFDRLV